MGFAIFGLSSCNPRTARSFDSATGDHRKKSGGAVYDRAAFLYDDMRKTGYWGFELGFAEVLAMGLAAGFADGFAVGLAAGFAVDLAAGLPAIAGLALAFGLGLALVAAIAVPVIKKPEAAKAARSFFTRFTSFHA